MIALSVDKPRRRMSLTPMIDVVFLLLVFFMLAARFDAPGVVPIEMASGAADYRGAPRLVDVAPDEIRLNGVPVGGRELVDALAPLMDNPTDLVVLRGRDDASVQQIMDVILLLRQQGMATVSVVE